MRLPIQSRPVHRTPLGGKSEGREPVEPTPRDGRPEAVYPSRPRPPLMHCWDEYGVEWCEWR